MNWSIGYADNVMKGLCRWCFMAAYDIGHTLLDELCSEIKMGVTKTERAFNDKIKNRAGESDKTITHFAQMKGIDLSFSQIAAINVPNTPCSTTMHSWMSFYFDLVGDQEPNTNGEIHLEPVDVKTIHQEYCDDMMSSGNSFLGITQFSEMWKSCFR